MESLYWVLSRDCNQRCPHCYNDSEPGAPGLQPDEIALCVDHLPDPADVPLDQIILSGGEVLVWPELLFAALSQLYARYGEGTRLMVQTNGDLLDELMLDRLLQAHVRRIDVASMDRYHRKGTLDRQAELEELFRSRGMQQATDDATSPDRSNSHASSTYMFWGATPDKWIGPLWPRGRAQQKKLSHAGPDDTFCQIWSGAKGFLDYRSPGSEVNIQLADVYPCCPMTCGPIGILLEEPLLAILDRCRQHPVFQALNEGAPEVMGQSMGISRQYGNERVAALGNQCLWCDEFFTKHAPDLLVSGGRTERGDVDLIALQLP